MTTPPTRRQIDEMREEQRKMRAENDAFDALHGGRELLPIEQAAYEAEGAERFARVHGHGRIRPECWDWHPAPSAGTCITPSQGAEDEQ